MKHSLKAFALMAFTIAAIGCAGRDGNLGQYSGPTNPYPNQNEAFTIVLQAFNAPTDMVPPAIIWQIGDSCTPDGGTIAYPGTFNVDGHCAYGVYRAGDNSIHLEWLGSFSASAFSHEICHAVRQFLTWDADEFHTSICFNGDGSLVPIPGSLVAIANTALSDNGY
jgi:hypothetical protein